MTVLNTLIQLRRLATSARQAYTPADGEAVIDTTTNTLYIGNGTTAGGIPVLSSGLQEAVLTATAQNVTAGEIVRTSTRGWLMLAAATGLTLTNLPTSANSIEFSTSNGAFTNDISVTTANNPTLTFNDGGVGNIGEIDFHGTVGGSAREFLRVEGIASPGGNLGEFKILARNGSGAGALSEALAITGTSAGGNTGFTTELSGTVTINNILECIGHYSK